MYNKQTYPCVVSLFFDIRGKASETVQSIQLIFHPFAKIRRETGGFLPVAPMLQQIAGM